MNKYIDVIIKYGTRTYNGCGVAEFRFGLKVYRIWFNEDLEPYRMIVS